MTRQHFIILLLVYGAVVFLGVMAGKVSRLPDQVQSAKPNRMEILKQRSRIYVGLFAITSILVVICGIVGFLGMFFFWRFAPWIFGLGVFVKTLFFRTVFWKVQSGLEHMFNELELLLDGVVLTLVFFGPAKQLFF